MLFSVSGTVNAQISGYTFSQSTGTFNSIASSGTVVTGSEATTSTTNDTTGWDVTIPFTFNFNGVNYNSIYVNSNGGATFGTTTSTTSAVISAATAYDGAIAVMNRDLWGAFVTSGVTTSGSNVITNVANFYGIEVGKALNSVNGIPTGATITAFDQAAGTITMSAPATSSSSAAVVRYGSGKVFTAVEGTAPNRTFVIEWFGYNDYGTTASVSNFMQFQLRLDETTNTVSIVYGPYFNASTTSRTNQIGLRGASNTDYNNRLGAVGNPWNATAAGTANNSTVSRDNTNFPASGLTFTWTPPTCLAPVNVTSTGQTANSVTLSWTASPTPPAGGYDVYYSTTNTPPTSTSTPLTNVNGTTTTISGLTADTQYFFWVRANCSPTDQSAWTSAFSAFTGYCVPTAGSSATRYLETITTTGGLTNLNYSASSYAAYVDNTATSFSTYPSGSIDYFIDSSTTGTYYYYIWVDLNNDLDFNDAGETLLATTSYSASATGTIAIPASLPLGSYRVRIGTSYSGAVGSCGTPSNGNYVDFTLNIVTPTGCIAPTNVAVTAPTHNTAQVSWTASILPPANGYMVYYSTSATPPTASTVLNASNSVAATGTSVTLTGLQPQTLYYVWVKSVCSATESSDWSVSFDSFITLCQPPVITGTTGQTVCDSAATLSATADPGATINWYDAATGGNLLGTGPTFTTPVLTATTDYYVSASVGANSFVGPVNPNSLTAGAATATSTSYYIEFEVTNVPITLNSVDVFPNAAGQNTTLEILEGPGTFTVVHTMTFTSTIASDGTQAQTVPINYLLVPGTYRMRINGGSYYRNYQSNATFPYTAPNFAITTGSNAASNSYYFLYNLNVGSLCESARTAVTATVDCSMGLSEAGSEKEISVYPNPFTDVLNIADVKDVASVTITDMAGRTVKTFAKATEQLHVGELKSGMYIVTLKMKDGSSKAVKAIKR